MSWLRLVLPALLLTTAGCGGNKPPTNGASAPEPTVSQPDFVEGAPVSPPDQLLAWLEGEGAGHRLRLPVVVVPSPLGLASGYIAAHAGVPASEGLPVRLDDGAMSVSLADNIRDDCPYDAPCAIWVEGVWGATVGGMPSFGGPTEHPFSVRAYVGTVDSPAERVLVKRDS